MSKFSLDVLAEGIRSRHMGEENSRLVEKWSRTGLLRGLEATKRENMARLLENQTAELLREQSSVGTGGGAGSASGDLRGFSNIAFPIVRRVFGGLVANELVSIQPMSLPSGLLFYLDYTYGSNVGGDSSLSTGDAGSTNDAQTFKRGQSIYNNPTGKGVRSGSTAAGGQYDLVGASYSKVHSSSAVAPALVLFSGSFGSNASLTDATTAAPALCHATGSDAKLLQFDPQVLSKIEGDAAGINDGRFQFVVLDITNSIWDKADLTNVKDISLFSAQRDGHGSGKTGLKSFGDEWQGGGNILNLRRLNQIGTFDNSNNTWTSNPLVTTSTTNAALLVVVSGAYQGGSAAGAANNFLTMSCAVGDSLDVESGSGSTLTIPSFESDFGSTPSPVIPEIDIKVESIAVTAATRKLRARWSPELAQDLNAYHSLDAEVELTQILSEQVALEIDREILNDLLTEARGANLYWSRAPGKFLNKETGLEVKLSDSLAAGPRFTGTVREWYETLSETIIVANTIHRKTLRGSANFIVTSPDVCTMLEASVLYRASISLDGDGQVKTPFSLGAEKVGTLSNRFTVYKDPYFPRNKILVGYKGGSYLETGYVYAPYVPLIVTPTIFAPEDFTPRKGVMTRYGKKMVRADFYGTVTVADLNVI